MKTTKTRAMAIELSLSRDQRRFFFGKHGKYRLMTKGRRVGFTHGAAIASIDMMLEGGERCLWVDTVHGNIDRYVDRYFKPILKDIPAKHWHWSKQGKELRIGTSYMDFRSADRPENIEGFGYTRQFLNEAGIILKGERGRYLWENSLLPMSIDYPCTFYVGGTPKGKRDKNGMITKYFELYQKAEAGDPKYHHKNIPTDRNPFLNKEGVEEVRLELPEGAVRDQEFYGKFVESASGIIDVQKFAWTSTPLEGRRVRSWDLAATVKTSSDYYAGALCSHDGEKFQVQDMKRGKLLWPELRQLIIDTAERDGPDVPIIFENAGQQNIAISDLQADKRLRNFVVESVKPEGDKLVRAMRWACRLDAAVVSFLHGHWKADFEIEASAFTNDDSHAHDDQLDAVSQAWDYFTQSGTMCFTV